MLVVVCNPLRLLAGLSRTYQIAGVEACVPFLGFVTVKAQSAPLCVTANDAGVWQSPPWEQDKIEPITIILGVLPFDKLRARFVQKTQQGHIAHP